MRGNGYAISGGEDGQLLIYDAATGQLAQEIPVPSPIERGGDARHRLCRRLRRRPDLCVPPGGQEIEGIEG